MAGGLEDRIEAAAGIRPTRIAPLSGGSVSQVYKVEFKGSQPLVAKCGPAGGGLAIESAMLHYLATNTGLPVPAVIHLRKPASCAFEGYAGRRPVRETRPQRWRALPTGLKDPCRVREPQG